MFFGALFFLRLISSFWHRFILTKILRKNNGIPLLKEKQDIKNDEEFDILACVG